MLWRRGDLREALQSVHTVDRPEPGVGRTRASACPYGQAFILGILLEQGDARPGPPDRRAGARHSRASATAPGSSTRTTRGCWPRRAVTPRRWPLLDRDRAAADRRCQPGLAPVAHLPGADPGGDRPGRRGPGADGRGGPAGAAVGGAERPRPHPAGRRRARRPGLRGDAARGGGAARRPASPGSSWPAPSWRWPGCRSDPAERERLLRAALDPRLECGVRPGSTARWRAELVRRRGRRAAATRRPSSPRPRPSGGSSTAVADGLGHREIAQALFLTPGARRADPRRAAARARGGQRRRAGPAGGLAPPLTCAFAPDSASSRLKVAASGRGESGPAQRPARPSAVRSPPVTAQPTVPAPARPRHRSRPPCAACAAAPSTCPATPATTPPGCPGTSPSTSGRPPSPTRRARREVAEVVRAAAAAGLRVAAQGTGHNAGPLGAARRRRAGAHLRDDRRDRRPGAPRRAGRGRRALGGRRRRRRRARAGRAARLLPRRRRRRLLPGRRHRLVRPQARPADQQRHRRRARHRRTARRARRRGDATPTCSGRCAAAAATSASSPRSSSGSSIETAYAGLLVWDGSRAAEVLRTWGAWARDAPDEVTTAWRILNVPPIEEMPPPFRGRHDRRDRRRGAGRRRGGRARSWRRCGRWGRRWTPSSGVPAAALVRLHMDPEGPTPGGVGHARARRAARRRGRRVRRAPPAPARARRWSWPSCASSAGRWPAARGRRRAADARRAVPLLRRRHRRDPGDGRQEPGRRDPRRRGRRAVAELHALPELRRARGRRGQGLRRAVLGPAAGPARPGGPDRADRGQPPDPGAAVELPQQR